MPKNPEIITVCFYDEKHKTILTPSDENKYTSRREDGIIPINLNSIVDKQFLDILLKMDSINLSYNKAETVYNIVNKEYHEDGKRIFISLVPDEKQ